MGRDGYDVGRLISYPTHTAIWTDLVSVVESPADIPVYCAIERSRLEVAAI